MSSAARQSNYVVYASTGNGVVRTLTVQSAGASKITAVIDGTSIDTAVSWSILSDFGDGTDRVVASGILNFTTGVPFFRAISLIGAPSASAQPSPLGNTVTLKITGGANGITDLLLALRMV